MKKLLFLFSAALLMLASPIKAATTQALIINGEPVEKVVTKITFNGDLAVLTFSDATEISEDMGNVILQFSSAPTSIKDIAVFQMNKVVDGELNIEGLPAGTQVVIFDASGKQIIATMATQINVSSLKSGVYVLKAGNQIVKFVKQ
jgi:hypothetical protein